MLRSSLRLCSTDARYVEKVRLLDYWKLQDEALTKEFPRSRLVLMVDRKPLVVGKKPLDIKLADHSFIDLKSRLGDYGVSFDIKHASLLDAVVQNNELVPLFGVSVTTENPPEDSPVQKSDIIGSLADSLGGRFMNLRMAMLIMQDENQRNMLARFQTLTRWSQIFIRCPACASPLKMRVSKSGAQCRFCGHRFYPTFSPVAITLVRDPSDQFCLLVRHKGSVNGVYTCVAGFACPGESLSECARREIGEEVGIRVDGVKSLGSSQPWPMPDSSLMCAHEAVADMHQQIDACPDELESAHWFSREEVVVALERVKNDPFLKGLSRNLEDRQKLHYIPPAGAIAHQMIRDWVERTKC